MSFDPTQFIDREFEQELFEELLRFDTPKRILAIRDMGGMGKSHLLERLEYRCRTVKPRIPVSVIALDQLEDCSPLSLVKTIAEHLSGRFKLNFESFKRYEGARQLGNFSIISGSVYLQAANFTDAEGVRIAATIVEKANVVVSSGGSLLTQEQEKTARQVVVDSFFDDLQQICANEPLVIMFDAYEKCDRSLQEWIMNYLLERYFFNDTYPPQARYAFVVAGREIPHFLSRWSAEEYQRLVKSIDELRKWEKRHVEECLRVHGFNYGQEYVDLFYQLIERGKPPSAVIQAMKLFFE